MTTHDKPGGAPVGLAPRLSRLVLVGSTGYISVEAVHWMADIGCALIQLDHTGRVLATSAIVGNDHPALRRAQALAATRPIGLAISRRLLAVKLAGQRQIADTLDADSARTIAALAGSLETCERFDDARLIEAQAAAAYWGSWRGVGAEFMTHDASRVPKHTTRLRGHQAASTLARQSTGEHPSARVEVRARIGSAQRTHWEARHMDRSTGYSGRGSEFRRLILPHLAAATPPGLARVTGLSRGYCAQIRDGRRVPHARHWAALQLAGLTCSRDEPPSAPTSGR